ncbi:MAG: acylphosphatase [Thermotogae bacterium]|nr:acylphosphatase [Thermotogota bacterium]
MNIKFILTGHVQGVGLRYFVYQKAKILNIKGYILNKPDYTVEILACGQSCDIDSFKRYILLGNGYSKIENIEEYIIEDNKNFDDFSIKYY